MQPKTAMMWSSGKDAAFGLYQLLQQGVPVEKLLTSVSGATHRVTMHGLALQVLEKQLEAIDLPFEAIHLPEKVSNDVYDEVMKEKCLSLVEEGYEQIAFGDIFLEDLRKYREDRLCQVGLKAVFPLWKKDTRSLLKDMLSKGFKCVVVCVNGSILNESFVGRVVDNSFLADLPDNCDPCGENGEFHTFCYDGPIFKHPVDFSIGEKVKRSYAANDNEIPFWFCELLVN
ncbi:MAG: diphthine--ammonia ligase [Crocinitomicaceae bacterium]|nr:diphthine--ammonia ligase [Crocinitomicaceae bacterium]